MDKKTKKQKMTGKKWKKLIEVKVKKKDFFNTGIIKKRRVIKIYV